MNKGTRILSAGILAFVVLMSHLPARSQPPGEPPAGFTQNAMSTHLQGKAVPDFVLELLDGRRFRLSAHIGKKVIILNFFATWCGPCKKELSELISFYEKRSNEPLLVIGIDGGESREKVERFVSRYGITFPVGIDGNGEVQESYGVRSFPTTVLIGSDGAVQMFHIGPIRNAERTLGPLFEKSLEFIKPSPEPTRESCLSGTA